MFTGKQASMRHRRRSSEPNVFNQAYKYDMDLTPGLTFSPPISSSMPMSHRGRGISNTDAYSILNSLRSDEDAATPRMHRRSSSGSSTYTDIPLEFFSYSETANVGIEFGLEGCAVCGMTTPGNKSYVNLKCRVLGCEHFAHKTCLSDPDASSHLLSMHSSLWFHAIGVGGIELEANRGSVEKIEVQIQLQILPLLSQCELQSYIGSSRDIRHHGQSQVVDHRMSPKPVLSLLRARLRFSFEWKGEQFVVEGNYDLTGLGNFESAKLVMVDSNSGNYLNVALTRDLNGDWLICSARLEYGVVGSLGKRGRYLSNPETAKHSLSGSEPDRNRGLTVEESHLYNQINLLIGVEGSSLHHGLVSMDHEEYDSYNPDLAMVVEVMELDDIAMRQRKESVQEIFPQVAGRVRELACTQNGSRFLQDRIKDCDTQYINLIYREVKSGVVGLITDVFGNYLVQRLVESCQPSRRVEILKRMNRDMVLICCDRQGTRVLQKIIQGCESNDERSTITSSVGPSALKLMYDIHGSYVLNAMLDYFPLTELDFIIETAKCHMRSLAVNQHGLCVLKKILSNASEEWMRELCPFIYDHAVFLANDQFGNYLIQHLLIVGDAVSIQGLHMAFSGHYSKLACLKFASNVVEKCMAAITEEQRTELIEEFKGDSLGILLKDSYGNYVMQNALGSANETQTQELVELIRPMLKNLRKKIQLKWDRLLNNAEARSRGSSPIPVNRASPPTRRGKGRPNQKQ